jgi:hypothetical protein
VNERIIHKLEISHDMWCRTVLPVPRGTPGAGVRRELGRSSVWSIAKLRALKYFFRISVKRRDSLVYCALVEQKKLTDEFERKKVADEIERKNKELPAEKPSDEIECWGIGVKYFLDRLGHGYLWNMEFDVGERTDHLAKALKIRMLDQEMTDSIHLMLNKTKQLQFYATQCDLVDVPEYSRLPMSFRRPIAIFRLNCVYSLPIEKPNPDSLSYRCKKCSNLLRKSTAWSHFLFDCSSSEVPNQRLPAARVHVPSSLAFRLASSPSTSHFRDHLISVINSIK